MKINQYLQQEEAGSVTKSASMKSLSDLILAFFITAFSLFLASHSQAVYADGAFVLGARSTGAGPIVGVEKIVTKTVSIPAGTDAPGSTWHCAVTCRAEVTDAGDPGFGTLSLLDNGVIIPGSTQSFEMGDLSPMPVATTAVTTVVKAAQAETLSCALQEVGGTDLAINDASMSIVCTDLPNP
jgi:hypothetical protein